VREIYNKDDYYRDPKSGSIHAPMLNGFCNKPPKIFRKNQPRTETELRIKRGNKIERYQSENYRKDKYFQCFDELKNLFDGENIDIRYEDISEWVKIYVKYLLKWDESSDIIKSNRNASLGLFYTIRKGNGETISKKDFLKKHKIKEKHLNKVLQFLNKISIEFRKNTMRKNIGLNSPLSVTDDDFDVNFDGYYALWEHLEYLLKLRKRFNRQKKLYGWGRKVKYIPKTPKNLPEENSFSGFMSGIFFLKFIRECEAAHYEFLLNNKVFYNRGAFFIDFDISNFFNPNDFFYRFQRYEEQEVLQKIVEVLFVELIEEFVKDIYENDEDIYATKKYSKKNVYELPINFIQVIKESGFTPPVYF